MFMQPLDWQQRNGATAAGADFHIPCHDVDGAFPAAPCDHRIADIHLGHAFGIVQRPLDRRGEEINGNRTGGKPPDKHTAQNDKPRDQTRYDFQHKAYGSNNHVSVGLKDSRAFNLTVPSGCSTFPEKKR